MPQEPSVFKGLSVEDNIFVILDNLRISRKEKQERTARSLQDLGIEHLAKQRACTLSGGERRRLEIARVLSLRPRYLLLDEPYAGIDPLAVEEIHSLVGGLKARGIGVVITDHNVRETLQGCDQVCLIRDGAVWMRGTPTEVVNSEEARRL